MEKIYLKTLHFRNIQSHEDTVLQLHPRLNVIRGISHHGKSSLARGFRWWLENRPLAPQERLKSWFAKDSEEMFVLGVLSDGRWVQRIHENGFNGYRVGEDEEGIKYEEYEALRGEVPEEVRRVTQLLPDLNFCSQHGGFFLFNKTSGEVAKLFNRAAGLDIIDEVLSRVDSKSREANRMLDSTEASLREEETKLRPLLAVKGVEPLILSIERKAKREKSLSSSLSELIKINNSINNLTLQLLKAKEKTKHKETVVGTLNTIREWEGKRAKYNNLRHSKTEIDRLSTLIREDKNWLRIRENKDSIEKKIAIFKEKSDKTRSVSSAYASIRRCEKEEERLRALREIAISKRIELTKRLDYCETCGAHRKYWTKEVA